MRSLIFVALMSVMSGCATLQARSGSVSLLVQFGTLKYIESAPVTDRAAKASRVLEVARAVGAVASGEPVTVDRLLSFAVSQLPSAMTPADRLLATEFLRVVQQELAARVGTDVLTPESLLVLQDVLRSVEAGAGIYAQGSPPQ